MTWVIGAACPLGGYGVMVSDTQVTFADGRTEELVRKSYPVGPWLSGGFAGSVRIGFRLLDSISRFLILPNDAPENSAWIPEHVAATWAPMAREVFENAPAIEQDLGAQFLLVAAHPTEDVGIPERCRAYVTRFTYPDFEPEISTGELGVFSIGSGAAVPEYCRGMSEALDFRNGLLQGEVGNTGGWALALNIAITTILKDTPVSGIGPYVHMHIVERGGIRISTNDRTEYPPDSEPVEIRMPRVAQSWPELLHLARTIGADATAARCPAH